MSSFANDSRNDDMPHRNFRNPRLWGRLFAVGLAAALPGALAGGLVSLLVGHFGICSIAGAIGAGIAAAYVESSR